MPTLLLRAASAAACSAVNPGATTISTPEMSFTRLRSSLMKNTASWTVLNIFQLPAMKGMRMGHLRVRGRGGRPRRRDLRGLALVGQRRHPRQHGAAEELQGRAPAGPYGGDPVGDAGLVDRRHRIAAADDRRTVHAGHGLRHAG